MILVTGGMGFIGLHTAAALADAGEEVVIARFRQSRSADFLDRHLQSGQVRVARLNIADPFSVVEVMASNRVDGVVHLAVPPLVGLSVGQEIDVNLGGLRNVLEAARALGVERLSLASSVAVYAGCGPGPWREDDPLPVASPIATSAFKKAEEVLALHYAEREALDIVCVRIGVVYGPLYHSMSNLPSRLVHAAVRPDVALAPRPAAHASRSQLTDLIYVRDCAAGLALLQRAPSRPQRIYNLGGGRAVADEEVAAAVEKAVPGWKRPVADTGAVGEGVTHAMDMTAMGGLGFIPRYDLTDGIADYVDWLRTHPA